MSSFVFFLTDLECIHLHKFVYQCPVHWMCVDWFWQAARGAIKWFWCGGYTHIISFTWYNATGKLCPLHLYLMGEINIHNKSFSACAMCTDLCYANHGYQGQAETEIKVLQGAPSFLKIIKHGNDNHRTRFLVRWWRRRWWWWWLMMMMVIVMGGFVVFGGGYVTLHLHSLFTFSTGIIREVSRVSMLLCLMCPL